MVLRWLVGMAVLWFSAGLARAECWYDYTATGEECTPPRTPGRHSFPGRESCEADRRSVDVNFNEGQCLAGPSLECTCDDDSSSSSSSSSSSGPVRAIKFARGKFGFVGGMPWLVRGSGGSESSGLFSMGAEVELHMGRPALGIQLGAGIVATRLSSMYLGPADKTYATYPLTIGLTSSPIGFHTGRHETRIDIGLSFIAIPCGLCDDVGGTAYGGRLKLGIDSVWGNGLFGVDLLLTAARAGQLGGAQPYEAWAPPVQLRLSVGGRAGDLDWPMTGSSSNTPDPAPAPSSPPPAKPPHATAVRIGAVLLLIGLGAFMYFYFTEVK